MWWAIALVAFAVAYIIHYLLYPPQWDQIKHFNSPANMHPLFGMFPLLRGKSQPEVFRTMRNWFAEYKSPLATKGMGSCSVFLYDARHIEALFKSRTNITKLQPQYGYLGEWLGQTSLLISDGANWHHRRKLLTPTFHYDILRDFVPIMNIGALDLVKYFTNNVDRFIDVRRPIKLTALDTLAETAMGQHFKSLDHMQNGRQSDGEKFVEAVEAFGRAMNARFRQPWTRNKKVWQFVPLYKIWTDLCNQLHEFTNKAIYEREELTSEANDSEIPKKRKIFIDTVLDMKREGTLTLEEVRSEVDTFMFAGHDTTSVQLMYIFSALGHEKDWQRKCQEEIDYVMAGAELDEEISIDQVNQLFILERCIKECQRMYPSVPGAGRTLSEPLEIEPGVFLPSGLRVVAQIYAIHRNPDFWSEPNRFDPDRFLPDNVSKRHPFAFVPFAAGLRNCVGQKFAMLEMKIVLAHILHQFDLHSDQPFEDLQPTQNLVMAPHNQVLVKLTPRKP